MLKGVDITDYDLVNEGHDQEAFNYSHLIYLMFELDLSYKLLTVKVNCSNL
jgi:hypothetical protein